MKEDGLESESKKVDEVLKEVIICLFLVSLLDILYFFKKSTSPFIKYDYNH